MNWDTIKGLPSTNFRIFVGVLLSVIYVLWVLTGVTFGRINDTNATIIYSLGVFILLQEGLDVAQFKFKRDTYVPAPPAKPDIEDTPTKPKEEEPA